MLLVEIRHIRDIAGFYKISHYVELDAGSGLSVASLSIQSDRPLKSGKTERLFSASGGMNNAFNTNNAY
jgi:hypothetical protein